MKILIVGLVKNEQLDRIREEAEKRGHSVDGHTSHDLVIHAGKDHFDPTLKGKPFDYDLIYMWTLSQRRWEWHLVAGFLNREKGTVIVNRNTIDPTYNYLTIPALQFLKQYEEKLPFPESAVVFSPNSVDSIIDKFKFPVIVKASTGKKGKAIWKAENVGEVKKVIQENQELSPSFIIREFIPNDGDIRVFTVGYKAIGAMKRTPKQGDFRSNISQGGKGEKFNLDERDEIKKLAEKISRVTRIEIAGVDIILHKETGEPYILEVNEGPQFIGLEEYTDTNAALEIVKYFEKLYNSRQ